MLVATATAGPVVRLDDAGGRRGTSRDVQVKPQVLSGTHLGEGHPVDLVDQVHSAPGVEAAAPRITARRASGRIKGRVRTRRGTIEVRHLVRPIPSARDLP